MTARHTAANDDRLPSGGTARAWKIGAGLAIGAAAAGLAYRRLSNDHGHPPQVAYPPLDTPKPVAEDVWIVDGAPIAPGGLTLPVRMTVVRLANGDLLLHSPIRYTPALARELEAIGPIRHLIAPNIAHWTFVKSWQAIYPEATTWGVPGLRDRRQVRTSGVRIDRDLQDAPEAAWADELEQGLVPGAAGFCEAYFFHKPSRTLLLVDLIENLQPEKLPPFTRMAMGAAAATRGTTARYLRVLIRWNGKDAAAKIRTVIALAPEQVIVAHGAIFDEGAAERLRHAFAWLLRPSR
ncbi:DUF4336 domain-containing protein [Sphingomonas sp. PL-96]|uniref:DUF4336 domain-containing protein n=1 Tax=Sphingomonas sp. PL-96 TaxID=2887201 RepID=UPI001E57D75D|nr:DUF4336 domain-containing protein [Sphingomonas sp. PL-96]MCC2977270.1 DUF4336 domain-containing protein [Sphingomonas sp. PL-96]